MQQHLNLVEHIAANPDQPPSIATLFEQQAARSSDSIALTYETRHITYSELNGQANRLARYLRAHEVGPEVPVAILLDRSVEMIVAILAVLKAGGYYIPLEPDLPQRRLDFIVADTGARLTLTRQLVAQALTETTDSSNLPPAAHSGNAAYAIYTSGSTGQPKGVQVTHANVTRLFAVTRDEYHFDSADVWALFHSYAFDVSVWEIFGALLHGGRLVVVPYWVCRSPSALLDLLIAERVTVFNQTPSAFRQLLALTGSFRRLSLRLIIFAGEALDPQCLAPWFDEMGDEHPRMMNMYGPTETTVYATIRQIRCADLARRSSPIGVPLADLLIYLLDPDMQPVPCGVSGELYVSGPALARGYLNAPELTAARFLPDPFSTVPGARMYRSGDLARRLENGDIEYLGRIDSQVKIRGYRIEPEEVRSVLATHRDIRNAAVVVRGEADGQRLVAYYSVRPGASPARADLRGHLAEQLPEYMIPAQFVELPDLPLNANGKVDHHALPEPRLDDRPAAAGVAQTPAEEEIARVAARLLNLPVIGPEEDLFDLGMHSLLAGRMAAEIHVCIKDIFEARTIRAIAARMPAAAGAVEVIPHLNLKANIPLTWQQEQIWFLSKLAPESRAYHFQYTLRLQGKLDRAALTGSLTALISRHEILRTTFHDTPAGPVQTIHDPWPAQVDLVDVPSLDAAEQSIREAMRVTFDCGALPLVQWKLYRITEEDHVLLQIEHHLIHDGWEISVLLRELRELYTAAVEGRPPALDVLPIQYADYAHWQRSSLTGGTLARKLTFWEDRLRDYPHSLDLVTDHERPAAQTFHGAALRVDLDRTLYASLREFSRCHKVTLFVTMYSAFALLLSRYTGQKRLLIGTGVANRFPKETEGLLGMLVNTVVMTTDLTGDPTFEALLATTQRNMLEDAPHHDTPFLEIVRRLKAGNTPDRNPLFQVLFAFHDSAVPVMEFAGLRGAIVERHNGTAKMDINVVCVPRAEQHIGDPRAAAGHDDLTFIWEYNSDLFDRPTMQRMLNHYVDLLRDIVGEPAATAAPFHQPAVAYERDLTLWQLFAREAARHPQKTAIVHHGAAVTYAALAEQATRIAAATPAGKVIGISVPRSPQMIAEMLGILSAASAYLPLPPSYPDERIRLMRDDASAAPPPTGPAAESPAYIMYTSGSTGAPKGIRIPHRAVHNLVLSLRRDLLRDDDVVAQIADFAFDATTFEIWGALLTGATLAIIDPGVVTDPELLQQAFALHGVTAAFFTTSLFNTLAATRPQILANLRTVIFGGEQANSQAVARVLQQAPRTVRLFHAYGPTECTCFSTLCQLTPEHLTRRSLPIGKPLINYSAHVLDQYRNPLPIGIPGELYIGGDGLALDYLNQPALTAERFQGDPRLYRTGDRVRWLDDGNLEFLSRLDDQVKIRGFRVEPSEIEIALARHPQVKLAAVTAQTEPGGEKRLIAWAAPVDGALLTPDDLRQHLQRTLPPYMIPGRFVILDHLPLTAGGKVDRRALVAPPPAPDLTPASPLESQLTVIWEQLLGVSPIGLHQDFFDLGGHSLLAVRLVNRLESLLDRRVSVSALFFAPTISQLARFLRESGDRNSLPIIQVQPGSSQPFFFFDGDWDGGLYCRNLARLIGEHRPFYAIPPHGLDGGHVPPTIQAMAADRLDALLAAQPDGPFVLGGYCVGGFVALETARHLQALGKQVDLVVLVNSVADEADSIPWRLLWRRLVFRGRYFSRLARGESTDGVDWTAGAPADYLRNSSRYRLSPYAGRMSLIFTKGSSWDLSPELPWRKTASNAEIRWIPGDHASALTVHLPDTAAAIRESLARLAHP